MSRAHLRCRDLFDKAWAALRDRLPLVAGLTWLNLLAMGVLHFIPVIGSAFAILLHLGYLQCLQNIRQKKQVGYADFFWGFTDFNRVLHALLMTLIYTVVVTIGFCLLIVPGIYISIALVLSTIYFTFVSQDGVDALRKTFELSEGNWWFLARLVLWGVALVLAGVLCFVLGLLITLPIFSMMMIMALEALQEQKASLPPPIVPAAGATAAGSTGSTETIF